MVFGWSRFWRIVTTRATARYAHNRKKMPSPCSTAQQYYVDRNSGQQLQAKPHNRLKKDRPAGKLPKAGRVNRIMIAEGALTQTARQNLSNI